MFNPEQDRLEYGRILSPPYLYRYKTEYAIGTTFSLDLEAFLSALLCLSDDYSISEEKINATYLVDVCEKMSDKVVVFCENGRIKSQNHRHEFNMLDKMIKPKTIKSKEKMFSFHPKMWLVKYKSEEDKPDKFRFIVLSRNLTLDKSWDISCVLEGEMTDSDQEVGVELSSFIEFLDGENLNGIANEIRKVDFKDVKKLYALYPNSDTILDFIPSNGKKREGEATIVSPFLSKKVISHFVNAYGEENIKIVTRHTALKELTDFSGSVYCLKQEATCDIAQDAFDVNTDVHAKMYLIENASSKMLYLGSLNATNSATCGNVEMMIAIELDAKQDLELFATDKQGKLIYLDKVDPKSISEDEEDKEEKTSKELEDALRKIAFCKMQASIKKEEKFSIDIKIEDLPKLDVEISISPASKDCFTPVEASVSFDGLELYQLSSFYVIRAQKDEIKREKIVIIDTPLGDFEKERIVHIRKETIRSKRDFLIYASLVLEDDCTYAIYNQDSNGGIKQVEADTKVTFDEPVFEKLMKALASGKHDRVQKVYGLAQALALGEGGKDYKTFIKELNAIFSIAKEYKNGK